MNMEVTSAVLWRISKVTISGHTTALLKTIAVCLGQNFSQVSYDPHSYGRNFLQLRIEA